MTESQYTIDYEQYLYQQALSATEATTFITQFLSYYLEYVDVLQMLIVAVPIASIVEPVFRLRVRIRALTEPPEKIVILCYK